MRFTCKNCGTTLELPPHSQVSSGPCPRCSTWIDLTPAQPIKRRPKSSNGFVDRLPPDGHIDIKYNKKRERTKLIKMLIAAAIVGLIILFINHQMKQWLME